MSKAISFVDSDDDKLIVDPSSIDGNLYFQFVASSSGNIVRLEGAQIEALIEYLEEFQNEQGNPAKKWSGYIDIFEDA